MLEQYSNPLKQHWNSIEQPQEQHRWSVVRKLYASLEGAPHGVLLVSDVALGTKVN